MTQSSTDRNAGTGIARPPGVPVIESDALLAPRGELAIAHAGEVYRLRRTRKGGLILTK